MTISTGIRRARSSRYGQGAAVIGLGSRAIIYVALTALVLQLAVGVRRGNTDQGSALASLGMITAGSVLLVAVLVGVACYVMWRWSEALLGPVGADGDVRYARVMAFFEGLGYLPFGYLSVSVLIGDPGRADQGKEYRSLSAQILKSDIGRVLIGAVGVVVLIIGGFFCYQGAMRTFEQHFDFPRHRPWVRTTVLALGTIGSIGRGLIFAIAGGLVIYAAATIDPQAAGGLDSAFDALRRQPSGAALLVLAGVAFGAFALFALAEAVWRNRGGASQGEPATTD